MNLFIARAGRRFLLALAFFPMLAGCGAPAGRRELRAALLAHPIPAGCEWWYAPDCPPPYEDTAR